MTKEDKELLQKDLCARLPYGVKVQVTQVPIGLSKNETLTFNRMYSLDESDEYITVKPFLRPMSSMTEEEMDDLESITFPLMEKDWDGNENPACVRLIDVPKYMNFILSNHFDFMGLIPKGLAIEVTEENNPYKE